MPSDTPLKLFLGGLVAIPIVGRDQETGSISAQDFRLRFRHWEERLQADKHAMTNQEQIVVEKLVQMLMRRLDIATENWDVLRSWPDLHEEMLLCD